MTTPSGTPEHPAATPSEHLAATNSKHTQIFWSRLWSIAKVVGPSSVAVIALIISLLTYEDQHHVDESAAVSNLRQQAQLITFFQSEYDGSVQIDNFSNSPVSNAELVTSVSFGKESYAVSIQIGAIPACSTGVLTASALEYWRNHLQDNPSGPSADESGPVTISSMYFTDDDGNNWQYLTGGPLRASSRPPSLGPHMIEIVPAPPDGGKYENVAALLPAYNQREACPQ
jgi:hypothetical protein